VFPLTLLADVAGLDHQLEFVLQLPPWDFLPDSVVNLTDARLAVNLQVAQDQFPQPVPLN
jgi:hypothetical protein